MNSTIHVSLETPARRLLAAGGVIADGQSLPPHLELYATQADQVLEKVRGLVDRGELSLHAASDFQQLLVDAAGAGPLPSDHRQQPYLERFAQGVTLAQARHEIQQFSVFGLQFDVAQAKLVANARTPEAYFERLKVLLNEKGIPYTDGFEGELTGQWSPATVHFRLDAEHGRRPGPGV